MNRTYQSALLLLSLSLFLFVGSQALAKNDKDEKMTILLERIYVDGVTEEEIIEVNSENRARMYEKFKNWELIDEQDDQVVFQKEVDDISPLLKENGYIGMDREGILSIYEGEPHQKSTRVIQSFFQLDVEMMQSFDYKKLEDGIRIQTKEQYTALLNFYKTFSKKTTATKTG